MSDEPKQILMIARHKKTEALRMASGLTLLDDVIRVAVFGELDRDDPDVELQLESLDFAEVPVVDIDVQQPAILAEMIIHSDVVYVV